MSRRSKFGNVRVFESTIATWFDSKAEHRRWEMLAYMERSGMISELKVHPPYKIEVNGQKIGVYEADFSYVDNPTHERVVEDVKGVRTALFVWKKKLMKACHGIDVVEIRAGHAAARSAPRRPARRPRRPAPVSVDARGEAT